MARSSWRDNIQHIKRLTKNGSTIRVYSANIEYNYVVNGNEYSSKKIKWVDITSNSKAHHNEVVEKYFLGKKVNVFYNPKYPKISVLEPGFGSGHIVVLVFFFISLGSMTVLLSAKL